MPYSGDPATSPIDEVRFYLGDVSTDAEIFSDHEVSFWLARLAPVYNDAIMVAAFLADTLSARYASEVSINADGVSVGANELQDKFAKLAVQLRVTHARLGALDGTPYLGATDHTPLPYGIRPLLFGVGMDDNLEAGDQDYRGWGSPYDELTAGDGL